ncbi:Acetyl-/propionyl-coenzyme A carboxylase alpha chain [Mycobacterium simulans]|nr:Acetyl-/propionyl-coenzyme A carboxylase alpha chain [Mycobacterium simulans]
MSITRVLVANRGEIARRVFATCRRLGLSTVAVYTDPDAGAPHVAEADARVRLPRTNDYLNAEAIIAAARAAGADAVHPGYGFLAENPEFAAAVQEAGLIWVGPPVDAVRAMGSKIESKKLMAAAGVPILEELDPDTVTEAQLPVLVKASAGGGGRGMRVVHELSALPAEVAAAQREAQSAFGDPTVFCERYLPAGHHIEVQVMADTHGTVWAVGERECSIQRRHQKIIEEAPSPLVERIPGMRAKLFDAARLAAEAIGYTGAGTVEFLADDSPGREGAFYFLEMNTRLQVEHPVTEETTGLDLVELQFMIAEGGRLNTEPPAAQGYSIEARLYAEDPAHGWQPQAGMMHSIDVPAARAQFGSLGRRTGIRLDSGIVDGFAVSIHYDPMLAKVISYAPTRRQAALVLADALARARLHGLRTNRELLVNVLRHQAFLDGATDTAFFDTHGLAELSAPLANAATVRLSAIAAALADAARNRAVAPVFGSIPSGWRNLPSGYQVKTYREGSETEHRIEYRFTRTGLELPGDEAVHLVSASVDQVVLAHDGVAHSFSVASYGPDIYVDSPRGPVHLVAQPRFPEPGSTVDQGSLVAPMPGNVIRIGAQVGDTVTAGQPLIWLEAMKMEHTIAAPADGVLVELNVNGGQQVEVGAVLGVIASAAQPGAAGHDHPDQGVIASAAQPGAAGHDHPDQGVIASAAQPGAGGHDHPDQGVIASAAQPGAAGHDHPDQGVIASAAQPGAAGHDHPDLARVEAPESESGRELEGR